MSIEERFPARDLREALAGADVLEVFRRLPRVDQHRFSHWVEIARDDESHWRRIHALVLALRTGPFLPSVSQAAARDSAALG